VRILDEDIRLDAGANVILVDLVDDPAGPRLLKTLSVVAPDGHANVLHAAFMASPELLDYLRCHAQVSHRAFMDFICAEAIARGMVASEPQLTPIPVGPVQNRAADTAPNLPEPVRRPSDESADPVVSPVVLGTYFARREASGDNVLELLVLWRGSPGWHLRGAGQRSGGGGDASGRLRSWITRGGVTLDALFDGVARFCEIDGTRVPLGDHNVVLVDEVDSTRGPKVIKTMKIDSALPDPIQIDAAIRRSAELIEFVRCDLKLPDERQQAVMDVLCGRITGR
jgi:hypothetical protein